MKTFSIHRYELVQHSALNRSDLSTSREGVLIQNENGGVGCIQPWPELGDWSLSECLEDLKSQQSSPLVKQAIQCARIDGEARQRGGSLFDELTIPESHATLPRLVESALEAVIERGFRAVKVKRGKDWMRLRKKTASFMERFPDVRWRFDFNGALETHREFVQFLSSVPRERIDFIEDPFPSFELMESWKGGVLLGYDRNQPSSCVKNGVRICKPAVMSLAEIPDNELDVVFTSYMDHPIGQMYAAYQAGCFYRNHESRSIPVCGLATQDLYEPSRFSEQLGVASPLLTAPLGTGLGFDELIRTLSWQKL